MLYPYNSLSSYPVGSATIYRKEDKENTKEEEDEEEDVKGTYILLSGTLAVVTSAAVRGTTRSPAVHVRCSLYPKIHPSWYDYSPT